MDAPPVQYVRTSDGYDIAYTVRGDGPTVIVPPYLHSHAQLNWQNDLAFSRRTRLLKALADYFRVVVFDNRGQGMSDHGLPENLSLKHFSEDMEAVASSVSKQNVVLVGCARGGHLAVRFAAAHPERVLALVLISCPASQRAWATGLFELLPSQNWDFFLQTQLISGLDADDVRRGIEMLRETSTPANYQKTYAVWRESEVEDLLPRVRCPTLVLHPRDWKLLPAEESMKVAASIVQAQFSFVDGGADVLGDEEQVVQAIRTFLANVGKDSVVEWESETRGVLSVREMEVLRLLAAGRSNQQIADGLMISVRTVERHVANIYAKTGTNSRAQASVFAVRQGLA